MKLTTANQLTVGDIIEHHPVKHLRIDAILPNKKHRARQIIGVDILTGKQHTFSLIRNPYVWLSFSPDQRRYHFVS